ncbi:MAG: hypothetical protein KGO92_08825 [Bacteroidota bacterium]|nr:hypothetical protein [Bacteroidota bacterium]
MEPLRKISVKTYSIFLCLIIAVLMLSGCKKAVDDYDPTGKCGMVFDVSLGSSPAGIPVWYIKVQMDDGHTYSPTVVRQVTIGDRICF